MSTASSLSIIVLLITNLYSGLAEAKVDYDASKTRCNHCKKLVDKFEEGLKKSKKGNFGGGNTAWEEGALGPWKTSETRLLEIVEGEGDREAVCGKDFGCAKFLEDEEELVEEWYYKKQDEVKLLDFLCVEKTKVCCASELHFGKKCQACPGIIEDKPCSGHGKCQGGGDRAGKGTCKCDAGYTGKSCLKCKKGYYNSNSEEDAAKSPTCEKCDKSCVECTGAGSDRCYGEKCSKGYEASEVTEDSTTCVDINECLHEDDEEKRKCKGNMYCNNTPGGHNCLACHASCEGCTNSGAKHCKECKSGYQWKNNEMCVDINECAEASSDDPLCGEQEACVNKNGGYDCKACHKACDGCTGVGVYTCKKCAEGYKHDMDSKSRMFCVVDLPEENTPEELDEEGGGDGPAPHDEL